jgi:hypothetical protein
VSTMLMPYLNGKMDFSLTEIQSASAEVSIPGLLSLQWEVLKNLKTSFFKMFFLL